MSIAASVLEAMLKAGCSAEQIVAVVRADEQANAERVAEKREKNRIRQRNHRERNALHGVTARDERDSPSSPSFPLDPPSQTLPPIIPQSSSPIPKETRALLIEAEFVQHFWPIYPNKVGKPVALAAFVKARQRVDLETMIVGLRAYVAKTDDRAWCNPSTWLNGDRWNDQPAQVARGQPPPRQPDLADFFLEKARSEQGYDDGRTIEGSYERGDFDGPRQAVPRLAAQERQR
ncbi:hypothetical protein G6L30_17220 [Agrobacterium rhizogenes]|nr:hypothetical protein [Rhizobium rhizogenes]